MSLKSLENLFSRILRRGRECAVVSKIDEIVVNYVRAKLYHILDKFVTTLPRSYDLELYFHIDTFCSPLYTDGVHVP